VRRRPIVAIDGPAASGKSTTAQAVARELGFCHVDSGAVYRALTLLAGERLGPPAAWEAAAVVAEGRARHLAAAPRGSTLEITVRGTPVGEAIRSAAVTAEVSRVAAMPAVRDFVNELLREAAREGGVVMDGRDIGTVVFPDAEVKVFLVADAGERARRRLLERGAVPDACALRGEAEALVARDGRDAGREVAPLRPAPDAVVLDTTGLSFGEQVRRVVELVRVGWSDPSLDPSDTRGYA
jgi:cytidylate kinase